MSADGPTRARPGSTKISRSELGGLNRRHLREMERHISEPSQRNAISHHPQNELTSAKRQSTVIITLAAVVPIVSLSEAVQVLK